MKKSKASMVDMISNLPDPVLHLILSGLPTTEEVIRTSILSRRWRHLWTSVPSIDVDYFRGLKPHIESRKNKFKEFVCRVLANNSLDLDSFRLCCGTQFKGSTVGHWIDAAVRRNVKVLDLMFGVGDEDFGKYDIGLPHCLVTCATLEVLRLYLSAYRLSLPKFTCFPVLRVLELNSVELSNEDLVKEFLKSCPLLEDLSLIDCLTERLDYLCVSCPNLKNLRIDNRTRDGFVEWELSIAVIYRFEICCPKLLCLEFACFMAEVFIFESVPSLKKAVIHPHDEFQWVGNDVCELIAGISHVEYLSLRIFFIEQFINSEDLPESLPNLKNLELITTSDAFNINVLIRILVRSPNLESLHLIIKKDPFQTPYPTEDDDLELWEIDYDCIFERLKMVNMTGISPVPHHMGFIEFLLETSPVLETMSIAPTVFMTDRKLSFSIELLRFRRASSVAEIIFVQDQV